MSLKAMCYDFVEKQTEANRFGSISRSYSAAINQIANAPLNTKDHCKILDLGVGDGAFLQKLKFIVPQAEYTGIDISKEMLEQAKTSLPLITIEGSALEATKFLPHHSQDLVLAHFINASIPFCNLFTQAKLLSRSNGYFSLITTTYDSFPNTQQQLAHFISERSLLGRLVGHYYKTIVKNATVAANKDQLIHALAENEFKCIEHQRLHISITLNTVEELLEFGMEGTWFLNAFSIRMLPKNFVIKRLIRLFNKMFVFPYHDTHIIDVILAKK